MSPPIISPYKKWFAVKRILQTFLGGPKLFASFSIILFQVILYVVPVCIIVCVVNVVDGSALRWEWKALLTGMGILLTDVTLTFLIWILKQRKDANINPELQDSTRENSDNFNTSASLFDEEEAVPDDGCFKSSTWKFIASNVNMSLCHFSAVLASAISIFLCISILADEKVHPVLKGFVIFTICNARYSSVINAAPEVATFDPVKRRHLFYRPFYISVVAAIHFAVIITSVKDDLGQEDGEVRKKPEDNEEGNFSLFSEYEEIPPTFESDSQFSCSSYFALVIALMPLIWLSGILPPLDSLFPWLFEMTLSAFGGKSIGYTYSGTTVSLAFAIVGPLATFILSQEPRITFLLECLCGYLISCDTGFMPKLKASLCEDVPVKYFLQQLIKPAVTIACSLFSIILVDISLPHTSSIPNREIFHPLLASISISIVLTTKLVQMSDVMQKRKWASSRLCLSLFTMWHGLLTVLLHVWFTLELVTEHREIAMETKLLEAVVHSLNQLLPCILNIRFFALAITEPRNSTINIFVTYIISLFIEMPGDASGKFARVLFFVSISHSILKRFIQYLRMIMIFIYATFSSTLLRRKYIAGAALISLPLSLFSLLITSVVKGMNLVPMFTLPIFTVGFPRPQSFWKGVWFVRSCGNETQKILPVTSSVDWTIYADVAPFLIHEFAKYSDINKMEFEPGTCFIARHEDRLIFFRILSAGWKFMYVQLKGLEIQEQTSCHHQEAAWIDEMLGKYLHSGTTCFTEVRTCPMGILNSLTPMLCLSVPSYSESKSQLPSFLSQTGKVIFREMFFRSFSYLWIKGNPAFQGESYRRPIASGVPLGKCVTVSRISSRLREQSALRNGHTMVTTSEDRNSFQLSSIAPPGSMSSPDYNGNRAQSLIKDATSEESLGSSMGSLRGTSAPMRQHPSLREVSASNWTGSVSYPLIPGLPNLAVEDSELESLPFAFNGTNENTAPTEITNSAISPPSVHRNGNAWDGLPQLWMKQCVGDAIPHNAVKARVEKLCWKAWEIAFGTYDELYEVDMNRFFRREFAKNVRTAIVHEKSDFEELAVRAFRYASKLTLDEIYANGMDVEDFLPVTVPQRQTRNSVDVGENTPESAPASVLARSEEDEQDIFHQLANFEKAYKFCSYDEVPYWMNDKAKHIVSISADGDKNILRLFNYESEGVEFSVGELSQYCVEGVWASLNTELLYFTSDDDERYSIQHSKYLLRNICAQSAQTLGYPVYETTFRVNLFDFSLEQVSSS